MEKPDTIIELLEELQDTVGRKPSAIPGSDEAVVTISFGKPTNGSAKETILEYGRSLEFDYKEGAYILHDSSSIEALVEAVESLGFEAHKCDIELIGAWELDTGILETLEHSFLSVENE